MSWNSFSQNGNLTLSNTLTSKSVVLESGGGGSITFQDGTTQSTVSESVPANYNLGATKATFGLTTLPFKDTGISFTQQLNEIPFTSGGVSTVSGNIFSVSANTFYNIDSLYIQMITYVTNEFGAQDIYGVIAWNCSASFWYTWQNALDASAQFSATQTILGYEGGYQVNLGCVLGNSANPVLTLGVVGGQFQYTITPVSGGSFASTEPIKIVASTIYNPLYLGNA